MENRDEYKIENEVEVNDIEVEVEEINEVEDKIEEDKVEVEEKVEPRYKLKVPEEIYLMFDRLNRLYKEIYRINREIKELNEEIEEYYDKIDESYIGRCFQDKDSEEGIYYKIISINKKRMDTFWGLKIKESIDEDVYNISITRAFMDFSGSKRSKKFLERLKPITEEMFNEVLDKIYRDIRGGKKEDDR